MLPDTGRTCPRSGNGHGKGSASEMISKNEIVFLFDVDNTMLDNDQVINDLSLQIEREFGAQQRHRYFAIFEELRAKLGYADYLGALQRYRLEEMCDPRLLIMSSFLVDYAFADRLYPRALDVIKHASAWGRTVI